MNPRIIQCGWQAVAEPELTMKLFRIAAIQAVADTYVHAVYFNSEPPGMLMGLCLRKPVDRTVSFKDYLAFFEPRRLFDHAYIIDTYRLNYILSAPLRSAVITGGFWQQIIKPAPCHAEMHNGRSYPQFQDCRRQ